MICLDSSRARAAVLGSLHNHKRNLLMAINYSFCDTIHIIFKAFECFWLAEQSFPRVNQIRCHLIHDKNYFLAVLLFFPKKFRVPFFFSARSNKLQILMFFFP